MMPAYIRKDLSELVKTMRSCDQRKNIVKNGFSDTT